MKTDDELIERLRKASREVRPPDDPLRRLRRREVTKRRSERLAAVGLAAVLLVAAVGGSLLALGRVWSGHDQEGTSSGWTPDRALGVRPGQYFYLKGSTLGIGDGSRNEQETWWAPDGSGELRFRTNRPDKYVPYPPEGVYGKGEFPLPYQDDLSSLSTDPRILDVQLRERADRSGDTLWRTILIILDPERSPTVLPEVRAAVFEVAAGQEGVSRSDHIEDPVGRDAISLKLTEMAPGVDDSGNPRKSPMHWAWFFDPGTHQLMAEAVGFDAPPQPFLILESAIVNSRGAEPIDDQLLFPRPTRPLQPPPQPSPSLP
jgi:hypothetical protein